MIAELHVTRDNPNADLFVRLCDVDPVRDRSRNVCDGIVRLTGADSLTGTVRVSLIGAAHRFDRGHRLRLQVAGGAHPRFARNPGNGQVDAPALDFVATRYSIGLSAETPQRSSSARPTERRPLMPDQPRVEFRTAPERYRHWRLAIDGPVATLTMDVDEQGGIVPGYELKLNSYDLGVDIELYDAVQRLRFEHPEVGAVVITSGKPKIFCAGANIRMLAAAPHGWKVNFCKFTNETRNGIEDATANSGQTYLAAVNGTASGGGYELALACEHIMLVDDRSSAVSLPELPLLGVLPGTGGLTRVSDKRHVRRDLADYFSTKAEGVGGKKAVQWRLVDEAVPRPRWDETVAERAAELAARSGRPQDARGDRAHRIAQDPRRRRDHLPTTLKPGSTAIPAKSTYP